MRTAMMEDALVDPITLEIPIWVVGQNVQPIPIVYHI